MFAVAQPDGPNMGIIISRHRTLRAAVAALDLEAAQFARGAGRYGGCLERKITTCERGETRVYLRPLPAADLRRYQAELDPYDDHY